MIITAGVGGFAQTFCQIHFLFFSLQMIVIIIHLNRRWFHFQDAPFKVGLSCTSPNSTSAGYTKIQTHHNGGIVYLFRLMMMRCILNWQFKEGEEASEIMSAWAKYTHPSLIMCERYFSCWFFSLQDLIIHTESIGIGNGGMCARAHFIKIIIQLKTEAAAAEVEAEAESKYCRCVAYFSHAIQKFK